jgi:hypothetical protein
MHEVTSTTSSTERDTNSAAGLKEYIYAFLFLVITAVLYGLLFNHDISLSHSIGYNLYGAERILTGEIPYRDFHTLYPPAVVYINAWIFQLLGVSLYNALLGVFLFKTLTAFVLYMCGRQFMTQGWSFLAASSSLLWLRPNGPFKAVPMHYGALFLALALFLTLKYLRENRNTCLILIGVSLGLLALFKHNIGAYALIGLLAVVLFDGVPWQFPLSQVKRNYKRALLVIAGLVLAVLPVVIFMAAKGALAPMIRTLLFGPGDFLLSRLAGIPWPGGIVLLCLILMFYVLAHKLAENTTHIKNFISPLFIFAIIFITRSGQSLFDSMIFYTPMLVILAGLCFWFLKSYEFFSNRRALLALIFITGAAFMESFPRFAREQAIGAMPFVVLLMSYLLYIFDRKQKASTQDARHESPIIVYLVMVVLAMSARLFLETYKDQKTIFRSNTELTIERGRGVYFPSDKAAEIDNVVNYIHERVPSNGYLFPQSYAGSSYLFLADRNNPSGAQFWGGVGVTDEERRETLRAIEEKQVALIVTSRKDIEAEKYEPMRKLINENFEQTREFGDVIILEQKPK